MRIIIKNQTEAYLAVSDVTKLRCQPCLDGALEDNIPFWKVVGREDVYVCATEVNHATDILRYRKDLFEKEIDCASLMLYTVPKIREILEKNDVCKEYWDMNVIANGKIYQITTRGTAIEIVGSVAIDASFCASEALDRYADLPAKERLLKACLCEAKFDKDIFFPMLVFNCKTMEKEIWYSPEDAKSKIGGTV